MPILRNARSLLLGLMLIMGSILGVAMRPEDIETLMRSMNQTRISQTVTNERDEPDAP